MPDIANAKAQHIIANRHNRWISVMKVSLRLELGREADGFISQIRKLFNFLSWLSFPDFQFFNTSKLLRIADIKKRTSHVTCDPACSAARQKHSG